MPFRKDIVGFDFDKGEAGRNSLADLMKVKRGFGALIPGKLGRLFEDSPDDFGETVDMIKPIQRGAGLKESGWMAPGDETTKAFAAGLKQILPQLADARSEELANVDPGFLWQRLQAERAPKDKSLFPKGYRNWREMKELGETGSKVPHLIDELAEKNARSDLDYKIDSNFKAESQRIHGLTLLRAAESDHGGEKRTTPEPSEEESSEPGDSLAPASESDTLTPVPPSDTTETETDEEAPAEETPKTIADVPTVTVSDSDYYEKLWEYSSKKEGIELAPYYDSTAKGGELTVGAGFTLIQRTSDGDYIVRENLALYANSFPGLAAVKDELQFVADLATSYNKPNIGSLGSALDLYAGLGEQQAVAVAGLRQDLYDPSGALKGKGDATLDEEAHTAIATLGQALLTQALTTENAADRKTLLDAGTALLRTYEGKGVQTLLERTVPVSTFSGLTLSDEKATQSLFNATIEHEYGKHAAKAVGEELWSRLTLDQRVALTDIAHNFWSFAPYKDKTEQENFRAAIQADLLREPKEGDCQWSATRDYINSHRPSNEALKKRYDDIVLHMTGCKSD